MAAFSFTLYFTFALLLKTSGFVISNTTTITATTTTKISNNRNTTTTTTAKPDSLIVDYHSIVKQLLLNKNNNKATMKEACTACNIPKSTCHCLKHPELCSSVKTHNKRNWTNCQARMLRVIMNFTFGIMGIIGNLLVVIVTLKFHKTLSRCHSLIGGLAFSDLLFSISQTMRYVPTFWTCQWRFGETLCTGFPMLTDLSSYLSVGFILIIATERFSLIVCPHRKPFRNAAIVGMCVANVVLGTIACLPKVIKMQLDPLTGHCHADWGTRNDLRLTYDYTLLFIYFIIPLVVIAYEHTQIVKRLGLQQRTISKAKIGDRNLQRNQRITRVLLVIIVGYVLLVFPKRFVCVLKAHNIDSLMQSPPVVTALRLTSCLPYGFHVALNPIIYSFFDRRFRRRVSVILPCGFGGPQPKFEKNSTTNSSSF